jgi:tRNA nucleotidyltransferase (CCA-adding enzyme)
MTAATEQTDFLGKAFDQAQEQFRKATESTLKMQNEFFRQWTTLSPDFVKGPNGWTDQLQKFYKTWVNTSGDWTKNYQEAWERQYKAGLQSLEEAFHLGQYKDPSEFREKVLELWQKSFEYLKELAESQNKQFQSVIEKWLDLAKKANP